MLCTDTPAATSAPTTPAQLSLTWTFTETYTHQVALDAVAAATGRGVQEARGGSRVAARGRR